MRPWLLVMAFLTTLMLAGCTLDTGDDAIDGSRPATTISVASADEKPGRCFHGAGEGHCHSLKVSVDNSNNGKDFSTKMFNWDARDEEGGVYDSPDTQGPDAIAAEGTGTVTLEFDVDSSGVTLVRLHYKEPLGQELWADIPAY